MLIVADNKGIYWGILVAGLLLALNQTGCSGCKEEGCKSNSDCRPGTICVSGKCREAPEDSDTPRDTRGDTGDETDDDTRGRDTGSGETHSTDSESRGDSDSGDTECAGTTRNGQACQVDCECLSGHCDNGLCCNSGTCCQNSEDCTQDLCVVPSCSAYRCADLDEAARYECGERDEEGEERCDDGEVCNGQGACVPLSADCGAYNANGEFVCDETLATTGCYSSCTAANEAVRCAPGMVCVAGACVSSDASENGASCTEDSECLSGHCGDGFCCAAGECCQTADDCAATCRTTVCGEETDYQCVDNFTACGYAHAESACTGANRCDGAGACAAVITCEDQGSAYADDGGFACTAGSVRETCLDACQDNAGCAVGYDCHLATNTCRLEDGESCDTDDDCASGHCENDVCCAAGACCADNQGCVALCIEDQICDELTHTCVGGTPLACGDEHVNGSGACEGASRCDGAGHCLAVTDDCGGDYSEGFPFACAAPPDTPSIERRCYECESNRDCDDNADFCDGFYLCVDNACDFDIPVAACPTSSACGTWSCDETGDQCTLSGDPCEGLGTPCIPKLCVLESGSDYSCVDNPKGYGETCDDGLACNGFADTCVGGVCVPGPLDQAAPCFDDDPCTVDTCVENGTSTPDCANNAIAEGDPCSGEYHCFGAAGTCERGPDGAGMVCVKSEEVCSELGVCRLHVCTEDFRDNGVDFVCESSWNENRQPLACGDSITLDASDFHTREYFNYGSSGDPCHSAAGEYIGMEAIVDLNLGAPGAEGTVTVSDIAPASYTGNIELMIFDDDVCDSSTCSAHGTNSLTYTPADPAAALVIDSLDEFWPPDSLTLHLTCVPPGK